MTNAILFKAMQFENAINDYQTIHPEMKDLINVINSINVFKYPDITDIPYSRITVNVGEMINVNKFITYLTSTTSEKAITSIRTDNNSNRFTIDDYTTEGKRRLCTVFLDNIISYYIEDNSDENRHKYLIMIKSEDIVDYQIQIIIQK